MPPPRRLTRTPPVLPIRSRYQEEDRSAPLCRCLVHPEAGGRRVRPCSRCRGPGGDRAGCPGPAQPPGLDQLVVRPAAGRRLRVDRRTREQHPSGAAGLQEVGYASRGPQRLRARRRPDRRHLPPKRGGPGRDGADWVGEHVPPGSDVVMENFDPQQGVRMRSDVFRPLMDLYRMDGVAEHQIDPATSSPTRSTPCATSTRRIRTLRSSSPQSTPSSHRSATSSRRRVEPTSLSSRSSPSRTRQGTGDSVGVGIGHRSNASA
jgi:hypothetical protein